jgi:hypothetical protein
MFWRFYRLWAEAKKFVAVLVWKKPIEACSLYVFRLENAFLYLSLLWENAEFAVKSRL